MLVADDAGRVGQWLRAAVDRPGDSDVSSIEPKLLSENGSITMLDGIAEGGAEVGGADCKWCWASIRSIGDMPDGSGVRLIIEPRIYRREQW